MVKEALGKKINRCSNVRRGAAAVEFAFVVSIFIALVFGGIEFSRAMMVNQVITNAAREGARRAVIPGATRAQVATRVDNYLTSANINTYTLVTQVDGVTVTDFSTATPHSAITVRVDVTYSDVDWGGIGILGSNRVFNGVVVMRKE